MSLESDAVIAIAKQIVLAIKTAPKARGQDTLKYVILSNAEEISNLSAAMEKISKEFDDPIFLRDSKNVKNSLAVLIVGISNKLLGLNCSGCGKDCGEMKNIEKIDGKYQGPVCIFKTLDLGIALGSAVKLAAEHCVDNRIMYTIGVAARHANILNEDIVIGIPLACSGKNIFFDRK